MGSSLCPGGEPGAHPELDIRTTMGLTATRQCMLGKAGVEGEPSQTWSLRKSVPETEKDEPVSEEWVGLFRWWGKDWA